MTILIHPAVDSKIAATADNFLGASWCVYASRIKW